MGSAQTTNPSKTQDSPGDQNTPETWLVLVHEPQRGKDPPPAANARPADEVV